MFNICAISILYSFDFLSIRFCWVCLGFMFNDKYVLHISRNYWWRILELRTQAAYVFIIGQLLASAFLWCLPDLVPKNSCPLFVMLHFWCSWAFLYEEAFEQLSVLVNILQGCISYDHVLGSCFSLAFS